MPRRPEWSRAGTRPASITNRKISYSHEAKSQTRQIPKRKRLTGGKKISTNTNTSHQITRWNKQKRVTSGEQTRIDARSEGVRRSKRNTYLTGSDRTEEKHFGKSKKEEESQRSSEFRFTGNHRNWRGIRRRERFDDDPAPDLVEKNGDS